MRQREGFVYKNAYNITQLSHQRELVPPKLVLDATLCREVLGMPRNAIQIQFGLVLLVAGLSLWPGGVVSDHYHLDKLGHFGAYAVLAFLPAVYIKPAWGVLAIVCGLIMIGAGFEAVQYLIPGRVPSLLDFAANAGGVFAGAAAGAMFRKMRDRVNAKSFPLGTHSDRCDRSPTAR
jgi:hypothetical protein